jgi:chorismate mutase-like protein
MLMAPGIQELRQSIDLLDRQLVELVAERLRLVMQVGEVKRQGGLEIYDPERERELLERVAEVAPAPLEPEMARRIFRCIIQESRNLEQRHVSRLGEPEAEK